VQASYHEVLDATTHQDDKVGRFVAGIAFLTAAALVFLQQAGVLSVHYRLGNSEVALPALTLGGFLVLIMFSLLAYVLATSAPLTVPSAKAKQAPSTAPSSRLFFLLIAAETNERRLGKALGG
jgi:arginine exporter protein ArgO